MMDVASGSEKWKQCKSALNLQSVLSPAWDGSCMFSCIVIYGKKNFLAPLSYGQRKHSPVVLAATFKFSF